jgi:peptidase E
VTLGRVLLASRHLTGFVGGGRCAAVLPTAAEPLSDRDAIVRDLLADVRATGCRPRLVAPEAPDAFDDAEVIVVGGGDPWHLLDRLRATGCDVRIRRAVDAGRLYVGISAGAIVAGPSLLPQTVVSPFPPPPGRDLRGLGLVPVVVFPHRERPGRAERIAEAEARFGAAFELRPLGDRDVLLF